MRCFANYHTLGVINFKLYDTQYDGLDGTVSFPLYLLNGSKLKPV